MARSNKKDFNMEDLNTIDLGKEMGLTLLSDVNKANIDNIIPTGIPQYDKILGGGIPLGRFTDIYGKEQSGKSSFASYLSKITTNMGILTVWIDVEGTADTKRLEQLGVDTTKIFAIQPGEGRLKNHPILTVEKVGEELEYYISMFNEKKPGVPLLFIWDSIANTNSKAEDEGGFDEKQMGLKSKSITKMINKVTPLLNNTNTGLIIINQARDNIGGGMYQDDIIPPGGEALKHASSLRILVQKASQIKQPKPNSKYEEYVGHNMRIQTKKSKLARPQQKAEAPILSEFDLDDGTELNGFDPEYIVFYEAVELGLITKGQWKNYITLNGEELKLREKEWVPKLKQNKELYLELFKRVYSILFPNGFSPLENKVVNVTQMEEFKELKEYYEELEKEKPEEQPKAQATEQEDQ